MDAYDHPVEHFRLMTDLTSWLPEVHAQLQEHTYSYQAFGSWWFTFVQAEETYRVVYDGKEGDLRFDLGVWPPSSRKTTWKQLELVRFQKCLIGNELQRAVRSLIERHACCSNI